jgi:hypothetical protein
MVKKVVREIGWCWHEQNKFVSVYPDESAYLNQHSKYWSLKFYAKHQQMLSTRTKYPHEKLLLNYAIKLVRGELTLRAPELKKRKLISGYDWADILRPRKLLLKCINESGLFGDIKCDLHEDKLKKLSAAQMRIYCAWKHGESIYSLYGPSSYYRYVSDFKSLDIDIRFPPHKERCRLVGLSELFSEKNIATQSRHAKENGLIFIPH